MIDVDLTGQRRWQLFNDYIVAIEHQQIQLPRIEPFYSEHRFCQASTVGR